MTDLVLLGLVAAVWIWIAWVVFRRYGFFGPQRPPRFRVEHEGRVYDSRASTFLMNGIVGARHLVHLFVAPDGTAFAYLPRDRDIRPFADAGALEDYVRRHCGGEKGLETLREKLPEAVRVRT